MSNHDDVKRDQPASEPSSEQGDSRSAPTDGKMDLEDARAQFGPQSGGSAPADPDLEEALAEVAAKNRIEAGGALVAKTPVSRGVSAPENADVARIHDTPAVRDGGVTRSRP